MKKITLLALLFAAAGYAPGAIAPPPTDIDAVLLIFYTAPKIVLYYQRVAVARNERGTTDGGSGLS
jgi:hypothetical protein